MELRLKWKELVKDYLSEMVSAEIIFHITCHYLETWARFLFSFYGFLSPVFQCIDSLDQVSVQWRELT